MIHRIRPVRFVGGPMAVQLGLASVGKTTYTEMTSASGVARFSLGDYDEFSLSPDTGIGCLLFGRL